MSNDNWYDPSPSESLPHELLAMERQILEDSLVWERRVPPADLFTLRLRSAVQEHVMRDPEAVTEARSSHTPVAAMPGRRTHTTSRWRALVATVAAVVVVGLLGAVFAALAQSHGHARQANGGPTHTPPTPVLTPIQTPTPLHIHVLKEQPAVTQQPGIPVVAPSDPRVMYEYADNGSGPVLRHSGDGGKTWQDLGWPQSPSSLSALYLAVSPLDENTVLLQMDIIIPAGGSCVVHADMRNNDTPTSGGGTICSLLYRSQDGGSIWHPVQLPISGAIFGNGVVFYFDSTIVQGQDNRLYARVYDKLTATNGVLDIRILSTTDGGATWKLADKSLATQAPHVCEYAATPVGSTLFAISAASCLSASGGTLWRSDDAGATWTHVGPAPIWALPVAPALVAANANGDPNRPLLYAEQMPSPVPAASDISVSTDGGKTWQNAPLAGVPAKAQPRMMGSAALPNGSIVAAFSGVPASGGQQGSAEPTATPSQFGTPGGVGCYYWSPGASAWKLLTPGITMLSSDLDNVFVSTTSTGLTVTLSIGDSTTSDPLYTIQPFA